MKSFNELINYLWALTRIIYHKTIQYCYGHHSFCIIRFFFHLTKIITGCDVVCFKHRKLNKPISHFHAKNFLNKWYELISVMIAIPFSSMHFLCRFQMAIYHHNIWSSNAFILTHQMTLNFILLLIDKRKLKTCCIL